MISSFLLNLSTSAYFVFGASLVIVVCMFLIIVPLMSRIKKLDHIVGEKLSLLPNAKTFEHVLSDLVDQHTINELLVSEYTLTKTQVNSLLEEIKTLNDTHFSETLAEQFAVMCEEKTKNFLEEIEELKTGIIKFADVIRDTEKLSNLHLTNLVNARIDTTTVLINLIEQLYEKSLIEEVDVRNLKNIKMNLENGLEQVQRSSSYSVLDTNRRSGVIERLFSKDRYY